ncbi:carboxypeptidase-like regulatory domain-containing protein [uncultured Chryseobacterium sp.]|uniref:carboxypeptidase-like regulatory domain-containing protein n=1 Tax=uncultured Chryseobacterium sp. TaxID=259322 RepID=UPI0025F3A636|nr:carboxypeptidase-like regulatory domain-containing protein [uncultured Chryseobacterium sp.]
MKIKLLFILFTFSFITFHAQDYIFGKIVTEDRAEIPDVTVINIRTDERVVTNRDGHFMISGRQGDELRFIKAGYERTARRITADNIQSPVNITLIRVAELIQEVEIKQGLTGNLKIDSRNLNKPKKVEKLTREIDAYMAKKSDPRILAPRPGEFVQPVTKGVFTIGKIKDKWDDIDLMNYLITALGEQFFTDLKLEQSQIQHFVLYVLKSGFERKNILKYGYCSDADINRFKGAVLNKIVLYRAPQNTK